MQAHRTINDNHVVVLFVFDFHESTGAFSVGLQRLDRNLNLLASAERIDPGGTREGGCARMMFDAD
jgi:hypothetical protein